MQCHGLSEACAVVLEGDVLQGDVICIDSERIGAESAHGPHFRSSLCGGWGQAFDVGVVIVGDDGLVAVFSAYLDMLYPLRDDELLLVSASLDIDHLVVVHEGTAHLDGLAHGAEFASTVARHYQCVGVVVALGNGGACR